MQQYYTIVIRGLEAPARIGIHSHEQTQPQRLIINLSLKLRYDAATAKNDCITEVVSYEKVVQDIKALLLRQQIGLLETLAEQILALCFAEPGVLTAELEIVKPDVFDDVAGVGVHFYREK